MRHGLPLGLIGWALVALGSHLAAAPPGEVDRPPTSFLEDAGIHDLAFVNADLGWAVGDRGVIWHTTSGGKAWRMQASPVACRLDSVSFLDELNGWAAGGFVHPYTHQSTGVLLRTRDGGKTWQSLDVTLPALTRIRMFDDRRGVVAGYGSAVFPAGVLATADGGRTWNPLRSQVAGGWAAADFRDAASGVLIGSDASVSLVRGTEVLPASLPPAVRARLREIALTPAGGWLVGDRGLMLSTANGGQSWTLPSQGPPELAGQFDFHAIASRGTHLWIAGSPGSVIFHSADGGRTWETQATGQTLPLATLHFFDDQRGWAAGTLGTILATTDGGRTWRRQRGGGTRAALLGVFGSLETMPLELVASQAAGEGYLTAIELLGLPPRGSATGRVADIERLGQDAVVALGGSHLNAALALPLTEPTLRLNAAALTRRWDQALGGNSRAIAVERLVRTIRMWRPDVVATQVGAGEDGLAPWVAEVVTQSVQQAADPAAYPEHARVGLAAWQVKKLFGQTTPGQPGQISLSAGQFLPRAGRTLGELAATADGPASQTPRPRPATVGFQPLVDRLPQAAGRNDLFGGVNLAPGSDARRTFEVNSAASLEEVRRMAIRRRNVQQLIERAAQGTQGGGAWLAQTSDLTRDMSDQSAGELLFHLAAQYQLTGRLDLAAETHDLLLGKHPRHPLAEYSAWWLLRYYTSSEVAWRHRMSGPAIEAPAPAPLLKERPSPFGAPVGKQSPTNQPDQMLAGPEGVAFAPILAQPSGHLVTARLPEPAGEPAAGPANDPSPALQPNPHGDRRARAMAMARLLERTQPALHAETMVKLPIAAATRSLGLAREAERMVSALTSGGAHDSWWRCAQSERSLFDPRAAASRSLAPCLRTPQRPRLDGQLGDAAWKFDKAIELRGGDNEAGPAMVLLACDDRFLYIAATCPKAAGCIYQPAAGTRTYDADLSRADRIELLLDVDRDYATWYRLTFDHRGWTGDACFDDRSWNPQWFVAASETADSWAVEAAIPFAELAAEPPTAKQPWALGVQRIIPGIGLQSWTRPANCDGRADGFGLLMVE